MSAIPAWPAGMSGCGLGLAWFTKPEYTPG